MGCGSSAPADEDAHANRTSVGSGAPVVDKGGNKGSAQDQAEKIKMLVLGAGESGKSTIFKQMRILYGKPRDDSDLKMFGVVIRANITTAIRKLAVNMRNLGLEEMIAAESKKNSQDMSPKEAYDEIMSHIVDNTAPPKELAETDPPDWIGFSPRAGPAANNEAKQAIAHLDAIIVLWNCETMKEAWKARSSCNVMENHKAFLDDAQRICSPTFKPSQQEILNSRIRTTSIVVEKYRIEGVDFEMYDVGGQRSDRRKWIECFEKVDAVIFVAALSEYDQSLAEAKHTNRMTEAIELFRSVCNNRAFAGVNILLFLNKKDLFQEKIMHSDIAAQKAFSDYAGPPQDFDAGVDYFIQKFKDCLIDDEFNDSFIHVTCATDTNNMEFVLESTRMIIMQDCLRKSGLLGD